MRNNFTTFQRAGHPEKRTWSSRAKTTCSLYKYRDHLPAALLGDPPCAVAQDTLTLNHSRQLPVDRPCSRFSIRDISHSAAERTVEDPPTPAHQSRGIVLYS